MTDYIHPDAAALWAANIAADDRVLVIGATGWFGRTATALMASLPNPAMFVSSRARAFSAGSTTATSVEWQWDDVTAFQPTTIIDCAFLTRDLVSGMGLEHYVQANQQLTDNLVSAAALPSVRRVMTISSGAAVYPVDALTRPMHENPYGRLKREAEQQLSELASQRGIAAVIARAWSMSGAFVIKPRHYAISDMVVQASQGAIAIAAPMPVYRRYASVEDLLAVSLAVASTATPVVDSGGPLLEMAQLAEAVAAAVNPAAVISRVPMGDAPANRYYADPAVWDAACATLGFTPAGLDDQLRVVMAGVLPPG